MNRFSFRYILWAFVIIAGFSAIVMFLWNLLIPDIFGFKAINFWQSLGLLALSRLFFGGLGSNFWMKHVMGSSHHNAIYEKWSEMNSEQRNEFIRSRHHHHFDADFFNKNKPEKEL